MKILAHILAGMLSLLTDGILVVAADFHDVAYAQAAGVRLTLDAHVPDGAGPFPAAILVHGGG